MRLLTVMALIVVAFSYENYGRFGIVIKLHDGYIDVTDNAF